MAKANKFVHFNTRAAFDAHLAERGANPSAAEGNDLYYYTVYIKDTEEIYTHGKFYGDKGVEIDILALQNGDVEVGKALYQKLAERYVTVPGRIIGHPVYKDPSAPNFATHASSMLIIFDYIDAIDAFSGYYVSLSNNSFLFNYITITSTGDCVFGDRTIVTQDMFHTGNKEGTIGVGVTDIPVKGLKSAAYVDVEDIIYTLDVAETDVSVSLSDEEFETIVAHESINVVVNGDTYTSTKKNSFAGGTIIKYECSFAHHDCVTDITITFDRNAKTYYCVKQDNDIYAQHADFATELTGRLEATPELFTYRPSAGDKSIRDDNAFIRRVKGNSVVFNQILAPRSLTETSNGITVTQDGTGKVVVKGIATGHAQVSVGTAQIITGHKYAYWGLVGDGANKFYWTDQTVNADTGKGVIAQPTYASGERYFILNVLQGVTVDFTFYPQVNDLTAMFGAGNEPTTIEEFRALYPNSYYPYNPGELRNLACSGIKTVGFNQWDEQWERGTLSSTGQNDNTSTTIRSKNYIPVIGNEDYYVGITTEGLDNMYYLTVCWYDSNKNFISKIYCNRKVVTSPVNAAYMRFGTNTNTYVYGTTYNHDICINLHHTGYRDGEYESYKEVTHVLPLSQITNGEPLRKAGSVYDEINETEYIRRVGVREYTTGDKDDATLITDGRYTNYPLDEPIVTPIEIPIDFNYYVEDFGTEEAISAENSAPFNADIIYQFNAVDRIRQNDLNIDRLEEKVLALPAEFKTINGNSIIGSGDLIITAGNVGSEDDDGTLGDVETHQYVKYVEQLLTTAEQSRARQNIGAASVIDLNLLVNNKQDVVTYVVYDNEEFPVLEINKCIVIN